MLDSLDPPADLGTARARLLALADQLAGAGAVVHLRPPGGSGRSDGARCEADTDAAPAPWPGVDAGATVVLADTLLWRTGPAELRALAAALGPDRPLLFLEPTAEVGWRRLGHRLGRRLWRRVAGHHFEVDVPVALRAAGLEVVDLNRFGVGRAGVRSYVLGRAISLR